MTESFNVGLNSGTFERPLPTALIRGEGPNVKNIQIIDGADNATYSVFRVTDEEFRLIFPRKGQDLEIVEAVFRRLWQEQSVKLFKPIW
jgi:hypothetical protein